MEYPNLQKSIEWINLDQIIDNSYDSIFVTDKLGNILLVNSATARLLETKTENLIGANVNNLVKSGLYNRSTAMEAALKREIVTAMVKTKSGLNLMSTSMPLLDAAGEVTMVITNTRDKDLVDKYIAALEEERAKAARYKKAVEYLSELDLEKKKIVSESPSMRKIIATITIIAKVDSTVLFLGESGTGKEVLARYTHRNSARAKEPFIPVNCAAIPHELMESEFFGYVRGAFTGANSQGKLGLFEIADRGTLFLDEIGELPLPMQSKLLRVLETGEFQRLGATAVQRTNTRIIAATKRDLKQMVNRNEFRDDLYYRLNVIPITILPLRERPEDILALAGKFLEEYNKKFALQKTFTAKTMQTFLEYNWPGNIRELRNVIERMAITTIGDELNFESELAIGSKSKASVMGDIPEINFSGTLRDVLKNVEQQYINKVLQECNGRVSEAAKKLGIHRTLLYKKVSPK